MKNKSNISLFFALIILLLIAQGGFSLTYLKTIADQTENLYKHPYTVSNAVRDINIHLISMHRYMKDVVLAENEKKIRIASSLVNKHEQQVLINFNLIFDRYLGKSSDIQNAYKAFVDWKAIRDEVIFLKTQGKDKEAADITRNKGADHVALLNKETQKLIDFADNKAKTFLSNAIEAENQAFSIITILLFITVVASVFSAYYAIRRLHAAQIDIQSRMHLIDQNILMAKFDNKGTVLDISSHLCRHLGVTKNEVMGKQVNFFINDSEGEVQPESILKIVSTGKVWEGEIRRVDTNGGVQWIHSAVHPDLDEQFVVRGYTNIIQDITDQELAITDILTGLHNRRHFENVIQKEIRIANRNKAFLTFTVVDIDYFKKYNDYYGHPVGDEALAKVAETLKQSLNRPNDYVFRLGGEEFGIILSGLNAEKTFELLEVIRDKIEKLHIEHIASDVSKYVTISLGAYVNQGPNILGSDHLYVKADEALYKAKIKRNNVVLI